MIHLVLLSGGSGTRLWPLSNSARSKQFLKVLRDKGNRSQSMMQRTVEKIRHICPDVSLTISTSPSQTSFIKSQLKESYRLVVEPERRDTAPSIMLACASLRYDQNADLNDTVIVMPIDTYAEDSYYEMIPIIAHEVQKGVANIVLLGVRPLFPSNKYGYIVPKTDVYSSCEATARATVGVDKDDGCGRSENFSLPVCHFIEKPDKEKAARLMGLGALWNCGVFGFKLSYALDILARYSDTTSASELARQYVTLPRNSFDYEVVEKEPSVVVVPFEGTWKDLGTWNTLTDEMADHYAGYVVVDESTCTNVHAINETGLPMVVSGLKDAVVIATPDGILASSKNTSATIKGLVEKIANPRPMYESREWGEYRVIEYQSFPQGEKVLVKELMINPGREISYQLHKNRMEIWTVTAGIGEVVIDGEVKTVSTGSVLSIERNSRHACRAIKTLYIIEVQLGVSLEEEDIERFGNYWSLVEDD